MAFLELNGIAIPVTNSSARRKIERKGKRDRSFRGALRDSRRGLRRQWDLELCYPDFEEGEAFVRLFEGAGHFFDFADGVEASTSLRPSGSPKIQFRTNVWGAKGRGVAAVIGPPFLGNAEPSGFFKVDAQLPADWTILWSEKQGEGGPYSALSWNFFAKRSDGVGYFDGVRNDNAGETAGWSFTSLAVDAAGELVLRNEFNIDYGFDDLLILPFKVPEAWLATWTQTDPLAPKLPAMPVLTARGDIVEEDYVHVVGDVTDVSFIQKPTQVAGLGWINNAMVVKARLSEVDPTFYCVDERIEETVRLPSTAQPVHWFTTSDIDGRCNATLRDGDSVQTWKTGGTSFPLNPIDVVQPVYRSRGRTPGFRAPTVAWEASLVARLQTALPAILTQPNVGFCIYRSLDEVGTATQYLVDGAAGARHIFRIGGLTLQQIYGGSFLGTGNVATARTWNVGIGHWNGVNSSYLWNGNLTIGTVGTLGLQGITLGGLYNSTGSFVANGEIVELAFWNGSPGLNGVPTFAELEQYVIDRYLEGG